MTENEKRSAAVALRAARASIQKWWCQGSLVQWQDITEHEVEAARAAGDEVRSFTNEWGITSYRAVRGTCAIGAVSYAESLIDGDSWYRYPPEDHPLVVFLDAALPKNAWKHCNCSKKDWIEETAPDRIIEFNDNPHTTKRMVLALFTRAIKLAESDA